MCKTLICSAVLLAMVGSSHAQELTLEALTTPSGPMRDRNPNWEPGAPAPGMAVPVPAIEMEDGYDGPPPPVNLFSGTDSVLTAREESNVATAKQYITGPAPLTDLAAPGEAGTVVFRFGAVMPSVICAPLYVCDIALQAGEAVSSVQVGDAMRWRVVPAISGAGSAQVTHVVVKPTDIGLSTNMLITTDRRTYQIKLVSRKDDWMPSVSFSYPEDEAAQWAALRLQADKQKAETILPETRQSIADLDFGFRMSGDNPKWKPVRVYSDGNKTYIQFPSSVASSEVPALVALDNKKNEQLVNYRMIGNSYVADKVLDRAMLISGVGRQQVKVRIDRTKGN